MAFYPDLSTESQIAAGPYVRAIGWLSSDRPFATTVPAPELVARLDVFRQRWAESVHALSWPVAGGPHTCEFCSKHRDSANFGVPAGELLYVCPGMSGHYVAQHSYAPPENFIRALFASPLPGTLEYALAVSPFSQTLGPKTPTIRELVCHLRAALGNDRFVPYPSPEMDDAIWLGDFNLKERQTRVRVQQGADSARFEVEVGHGPFHDQTEFVHAHTHRALTAEDLRALIDAEFTPRETRR